MKALSILDFNFLGIPFFAKNYRKRLKLLIKEVVKVNPDMVCFQELWFRQTRNYLLRKLRKAGFNY